MTIIKNHGYKNGVYMGKMIKKGEHLSPKTEFKKGLIPWNAGTAQRFKLICKVCNKPFYVVKNRVTKAKLCSLKCAGKSNSGANNVSWKGGRVQIPTGYIKIKQGNHPFCDKAGYVMEHRLVMEKHIGRYLKPEEVVHHIDHNVANNKIENLQLFESNEAHSTYHYEQKKNDPNWGFMKQQKSEGRSYTRPDTLPR